MISFIEENVQDSVLEGLVPYDYSGYTIVEAAMDTINYVNEAFADIQMSTLLEEYKYLYEHGEEIVYEEESGEGQKSNIITKIVDAIKRWGQKIFGMLQAAAQRIQAIATSASTRVGVSKKQFDSMDMQYIKNVTERFDKRVNVDLANMDIKSELINDWNTENIPETTTQEVVKKYVVDGAPQASDSWYSKKAVGDTVFGGYKNIGKKILDARKVVNKQMDENIKKAKKEMTENMEKVMAYYSKAMKHNTAVIGGLLQVFAIYSSQCKTIAQGAIRFTNTANKADDKVRSTGGSMTSSQKADAFAKQFAANERNKANIDKANAKTSEKVHRYESTKKELKDEKKAEKEKKAADRANNAAKKRY